MVDKVNGSAKAGGFMGGQLKYFRLIFLADVVTTPIPGAPDPVAEKARQAAAQARVTKIFDIIGEPAQPVLIGDFVLTNPSSFIFAYEHDVWGDGSGLAAELAAIPGMSNVGIDTGPFPYFVDE